MYSRHSICFEFRSLIFVWNLYFDAWNFHYFHKIVTLFILSNYLFKWPALF